MLDIIVALSLIIVFLPFWIIVPILIVIDSGPPIFFRHKRLGRFGNEFYLWKFRSMVPNADKILHEQDPTLLKKFKDGDWKFKADEDPRITKLGRILRSLIESQQEKEGAGERKPHLQKEASIRNPACG